MGDKQTTETGKIPPETPCYTHSFIYLIDMGDEFVWCDSPDPNGNVDERDVLEYVRSDFYEDVCEERNELQLTLALVQSRINTVTKKWQEQTGQDSMLPDLGALIEWGLSVGDV